MQTKIKKPTTTRAKKNKLVPQALPAEFNVRAYDAATKLDRVFGGDNLGNGAFKTGIEKLRELHLTHLNTLDFRTPIYTLRWPSTLYIPAKADWKNYWFTEPPADHRYGLSWTAPSPPLGYNFASHDAGTLSCFQQIKTTDRYVQSEAGLGIRFTPKSTLSVVSLQPQVNCSGDYRWYALFDQPVAGYTWIKTSLILAVWQKIPGSKPWDLLTWKQHQVIDAGPNSGQGYHAVTPYQRAFTGQELATPFLVEKERTYLFGVVARVSIWSTLTDDGGRPLPLIQNGSLRVWGTLTCTVPQIEVKEQQVHIP